MTLIDFAPGHARRFLIDPHPPEVADERMTIIQAGASEGVGRLKALL